MDAPQEHRYQAESAGDAIVEEQTGGAEEGLYRVRYCVPDRQDGAHDAEHARYRQEENRRYPDAAVDETVRHCCEVVKLCNG